MIYTITLNPALDRTLWVQRVKSDVSNRIIEEKSFAGGKSVDVSKVLKNLGVDNIALGFVGGFAGRELEGRLLNEGIQTDFVHVSGETRTNIIIHEKETGKQLAFNARGPEIHPAEIMEFIELLQRLPCSDLVAIGGSLPQAVSPEIYTKIITIVKRCHSTVVLDVDGEALRTGISARADVIKPNIHELSELVGRELQGIEEIAAAAREINRQGVKIVLVSMGARGILMVSEGEEFLAVPPKVDVASTIGAGDSSVAGFISGLVQKKGLDQCIAYAAAAGTATTLHQGTALAQKEDFDRLVPQVQVTALADVIEQEKKK